MAEGSIVSPKRTKNFEPDVVRYYLARKFKELLAKGTVGAGVWWKKVPIFTPSSLRALVDSWKEEEEVTKLLETAHNNPVIGMHY